MTGLGVGSASALDAATSRLQWAAETVERAWLASGALPAGIDGQAATIASVVFAAIGRAPGQGRIAPPPRADLAAAVAVLDVLNAVDAFAARLLLSRALGAAWPELERRHGRSKPTLRQHQAAALARLAGAIVGDGR